MSPITQRERGPVLILLACPGFPSLSNRFAKTGLPGQPLQRPSLVLIPLLQNTRGSVQLARALEEDRAATSDPGGQKTDAACLLPHSTPTLPPGSDHLTTHPSLGCCSQEAPIPHWLWQSRHCTRSWGWKGRREKNFGLAAPNQSCNLYGRGAQTLYPPSPSSPAFPPQSGNLESTLCKVWVRPAAAEFWQLPFTNVFVRSNIQNQVGKRPRGNCVVGGGA